MKNAIHLMKSLFTVSRHASAGANATPLRLARQGLRYYLSPSGYSLPPLSVFFIVNSRCNMRCQMCDVGQKNPDSMFYKNLIGEDGITKGDFPIERFESLMDEFKAFSPYVSITSTEPLLYSPLPRAIRAAKERGMGVNVTSNGLLLAKRYEELFESNLDSLTLSIDGPAEIHERIRGVPGAFDTILEGVNGLVELKRANGGGGPKINVNTVVSNLNQGTLLRLMESLPLDGIDQVSFTLMSFCHKELADAHNELWGDKYPATQVCLEGDCDPFKVDPVELSHELREVRNRYGTKVYLPSDISPQHLKQYFHRPMEFLDTRKCLFPWFTAQITASGELIGVTRCYPAQFGSVLDKPFLDLWNGEAIRAFRRDLRANGRFTACTRCEGVLY